MGKKLAVAQILVIVLGAACLGDPGEDANHTTTSGQDGGTEGSTTCSGAACTAGCPTGFADCDGDTSNGCETNVDSDIANCGACGATCGSANTSSPPTCAKGVCALTCSPGFLHCAAGGSQGCETAEDASSCGACGHTCGGAACTAGLCDSIPIATGQSSPMGISIDSVTIYWAEYGADKIRRAGLSDAVCAGNACAVLADTTTAMFYSIAGESPAPRHNPLATSSDGLKLYFTCKDASGTGQTGALAVSLGGGEVDLSGSGTGASYSILAENGYAFYTNRTGTEGVSTWDGNKTHGPDSATSQSTGQTPGVDALASDTGKLYFADGVNGLIFSRLESDFPNETSNASGQACDMNQSGAAPVCNEALAAPGVKLVAVASGVLFWSDATSIHRYKFLDASSAVIATNQNVGMMKADASGVYWARLDDDSVRTAKSTDPTCDGTACKVLIPHGVGTVVSGLALDTKYVYASFSGSGLVTKCVK